MKDGLHVAIILDGNGRWAKRRGLPRNAGHRAGMEAIKKTVLASCELGIKILSLFAFSTENWKRSQKEIDGIFGILRDYLDENIEVYKEKGINLRIMGDLSKLPEDISKKLISAQEETASCDKLIVNVGINYGGRDELVRAFNLLLKEGKSIVSAEDIKKKLYTHDLPDPDLVIRTSGEQRLSNFMLFQCAYSELYFPKILWPDFNKNALKKALSVYKKRDRRFGNVTEEKK